MLKKKYDLETSTKPKYSQEKYLLDTLDNTFEFKCFNKKHLYQCYELDENILQNNIDIIIKAKNLKYIFEYQNISFNFIKKNTKKYTYLDWYYLYAFQKLPILFKIKFSYKIIIGFFALIYF